MHKALFGLLLLPLAASAAAEPPPVQRATVETRAERMFDAADRNRDGRLSRDEYHAAVLAIARRLDPNIPADGPGMTRALAQYDLLARGDPAGIPRAAFVAAALAHFDGADLNHDGTVTPDEARRAAKIKQRAAGQDSAPPSPRP